MNLPSKNRIVDIGVFTRAMNNVVNCLQNLNSVYYVFHIYVGPGTVDLILCPQGDHSLGSIQCERIKGKSIQLEVEDKDSI